VANKKRAELQYVIERIKKPIITAADANTDGVDKDKKVEGASKRTDEAETFLDETEKAAAAEEAEKKLQKWKE
jgi:hypothetical protein